MEGYSAFIVSSGSVRPARCAGSHDAAADVATNVTAAEASAMGSVAEIPNKKDSSNLPTHDATAAPRSRTQVRAPAST